jgi:hypothetical protein
LEVGPDALLQEGALVTSAELLLEPWEMQSALFVLGYTDELEADGEISAAAEVACTDWTGAAA